MIISIFYKGRKKQLEINKTDTVKGIMEKFFVQENIDVDKRFYTKDKFLLNIGDILLNSDPDNLNKTVDDLQLEDDDMLTLVNTEEMNAGTK